jgi:hypothetical protein
MKKLKIDMGELVFAMQSHFSEMEHYLDLETGKIEAVSELAVGDEELKERIEAEKGRYKYIEPIPSYEAYQLMEEFIETVEDENLKEKLYIAIDGKGAFRRFKNMLLNYPVERERWFKFENEKMEEYAREWLESIGVEPEQET